MIVLIIIKSYSAGWQTSPLSHICCLFNLHNPNPKLIFDYFDSIIKNYQDKLPLIFGKWDFLKENLGFLLYHNFDFLIDKEIIKH